MQELLWGTLGHREQREQNQTPEESLCLQNLEVRDLDSSLFSNAICASSPDSPLTTYVFRTRWH